RGLEHVHSAVVAVLSPKVRRPHRREAITEAALLPDPFKTARWALRAMHPRQPLDGFTNEVRLDELDPESALQVRDVLNAGATIGAVRETGAAGQNLGRSELHPFLSHLVKREAKPQPEGTGKRRT